MSRNDSESLPTPPDRSEVAARRVQARARITAAGHLKNAGAKSVMAPTDRSTLRVSSTSTWPTATVAMMEVPVVMLVKVRGAR